MGGFALRAFLSLFIFTIYMSKSLFCKDIAVEYELCDVTNVRNLGRNTMETLLIAIA